MKKQSITAMPITAFLPFEIEVIEEVKLKGGFEIIIGEDILVG